MRQQFLIVLVAVLVSISVEVVVNPVHARKHRTGNGDSIVISSLPSLQALNCTPSLGEGKKHGGSGRMEMVSRYGGCSKLKGAGTNFSLEHMLLRDQLRLDSWLSKLTNTSATPATATSTGTRRRELKAASGGLASHASYPELSALNYYVTVGLGTPKVDLSLTFDTGSSLTWTQCKPCATCYNQVDPLFDPSSSSTYSKLSCSSAACSPNFLPNRLCATSTDSCGYNQTYLDGSFTAGYFSSETLTLTPTDSLTGFFFGCGIQNEGIFGELSGLLGLDMGNVSIVSQGSSVYGKLFSYCMPELFSNTTGHLTFGGNGTTSTSIQYTPLIVNNQLPNAYFVELQAISVAGKWLNISTTVFSNPGTILDSGTTYTYLPPEAYSALLNAFTEYMDAKNYPTFTPPSTISLEGCYDLTGIDKPLLPSITLLFKGGATMDMDVWGTVFRISNSDSELKVCLAFASNGQNSGLSIVGNMQQQTFDIIYDIDGGKIGFGAGGC